MYAYNRFNVAKAPPGRDKARGIGTQQFEVEFRVPKPGGIRKGWQRAAVSIADLRVFVFEAAADAPATAAGSGFSHELVASNIIDIRCALHVQLVGSYCHQNYRFTVPLIVL